MTTAPDPASSTAAALHMAADLVAEFEGFSAKPYYCPAGTLTIGYGTTRPWPNRRLKVTDDPINRLQARTMLIRDLTATLATLTQIKPDLSVMPHRLAALLSLAYNIGTAALIRSTLWAHLLADDYDAAAEQFPRWCKSRSKILTGLRRRRAAEQKLFSTDQG